MTMFRTVALLDGVSGQLYLHSMPGRYEPLEDVWGEVWRLGVSRAVCLAPLDEIREKSPEYANAIEAGETPCALSRLPVRDFQGPDDDRALWQLATQVADALRRGDRVLIHCGAGIGRTGMFATAVLIAMGLSLQEARSRVKAAGSGPERPAQEEALLRVAQLRQASASD